MVGHSDVVELIDSHAFFSSIARCYLLCFNCYFVIPPLILNLVLFEHPFSDEIYLQEPLSSLAAEYQSGSTILLEKIKVLYVVCFSLLALLLFGSRVTNCHNLFLRYLVNNMLPFGGHAEMGTASIGALCFRTLYVFI